MRSPILLSVFLVACASNSAIVSAPVASIPAPKIDNVIVENGCNQNQTLRKYSVHYEKLAGSCGQIPDIIISIKPGVMTNDDLSCKFGSITGTPFQYNGWDTAGCHIQTNVYDCKLAGMHVDVSSNLNWLPEFNYTKAEGDTLITMINDPDLCVGHYNITFMQIP